MSVLNRPSRINIQVWLDATRLTSYRSYRVTAFDNLAMHSLRAPCIQSTRIFALARGWVGPHTEF